MRYLAVMTLIAFPASAQDYGEKSGVKLFSEQPCTEAIAVIDAAFPDFDGSDVEGWARDATKHMAKQGQAWGFILGYDTARGGLSADGKTTLERLRNSCAENTHATALELLNSL